jgi:MFS family permease
MKISYRGTRRACHIGSFTQAIITNLAPLFFIVFQRDYGLRYDDLANLILITFVTQIAVDILSTQFAGKIGYRRCLVFAHAISAAGLVMLSLASLVPVPIYWWLLISVIAYSFGGGLMETLLSPVLDAIPAEDTQRGANMAFLHSFYCWGQVSVVAITTFVLLLIGEIHWRFLPILWAIVPLINSFLLGKAPLPPMTPEHERTPIRRLLLSPVFLAALVMMMCAGAAELTVSQWSSLFAEEGLGMNKFWGDLAGPCLFAALMGVGRVIYGVRGEKMNLKWYIAALSVLCVAGYLLTSLAPVPALNLVGCGLCGFSVSIMWPGVISLTARYFPKGGAAMFGVMALAGDVGCSLGPWLAGIIADKALEPGAVGQLAASLFHGAGMELKMGILICAVFPLLLSVAMLFLRPKTAA